MGDVAEYWNDVRDHRRRVKQQNAKRDAERADSCLQKLARLGFNVIRFSEHHYRVDQRYDYWPTTGRWRKMDGTRSGMMLPSLIEELNR